MVFRTVIRNVESTSGERLTAADLVCVGEALLRLATPAGVRLATAPSLEVHVAGAEANVAVAAARLGVSTRWVSALPDDVLGHRVAAALTAAGVCTDAIAWDAAPGARLGLFFSDTGVAPRPATVTYDRAGSAFTRLSALPPNALDGARRVHVTGITAAVAPPALTKDIISATAAAGAALSVDVNHRARLWSAEAAREGLAPLLAAADTVLCGIADAHAVFGLDGAPDAVARALRERHAPSARLVVLTLGEGGALALDAGDAVHEQPAVPAQVVDRFGMGDAFAAGLLWVLLGDGDVPAALRAGATLAALKATTYGDLSQTTAGELHAALAGTSVARSVLR
jgi:2-dehydro-3-deoxygluconokinase